MSKLYIKIIFKFLERSEVELDEWKDKSYS